MSSDWASFLGMQLVQGKLADMYTVTQATRAFVYKTAEAADQGRADRKDCAAVILYAAEHATKMALDAIQLLGGNGYINEYPTGRLLRDAKLYEIGAGTSEIRRMLIGRELYKEHSSAWHTCSWVCSDMYNTVSLPELPKIPEHADSG